MIDSYVWHNATSPSMQCLSMLYSTDQLSIPLEFGLVFLEGFPKCFVSFVGDCKQTRGRTRLV